MSKDTNTLTRRKFLKVAAYTSALSIGGLSNAVLANSARIENGMVIESDKTTITLLNKSDRTVVLDAANPVNLEKVHDWVVVKINKTPGQGVTEISDHRGITLATGQERSFEVDAKLAPALKDGGSFIVITNEYSALDNVVPVATFDTLVA